MVMAEAGHPLRPDGLRLRRPPRDVGRLPRGASRPSSSWPSPPIPPTCDRPDGIRVAWLESAAERIPQETLERIPQGGIPLDDLTDALRETGFEGAAQACFLGPSPRPATSSSTTPTKTAIVRRLLRPLGRRRHRGGHGGVAQSQSPSWTRWAS